MCGLPILFLNHGLEFGNFVCNRCHDLTMCLNINDIAIITVKSVDYHCIIHDISSSEAIRLLGNSVIDDCGYIEKCLLVLTIESVFLWLNGKDWKTWRKKYLMIEDYVVDKVLDKIKE